ncbi:hypothetical protein AVEN_168392-1 [Araneus ventricosus]|uniref:Uncharacterized protein n=1 Tax=Araneus ventricosus TaxID=182803 RepID=A0A4Y2GPY7_ARAVE|nr:hypothetical protein AVEN_168392-1 [Araneus ventricosus]
MQGTFTSPTTMVTLHKPKTAEEKKAYPDSNFSLQQAFHKFVMTRVQVCYKFVMTRVQACSKLTKAPKLPWNELAGSLQCKLIANYSKNRVRNTI